MAIISLANAKGGCGKTTISINLAAVLPAALVDADPQASLATAGGRSDLHIVTMPLHEKSQIPEFMNRIQALAKQGHVIVDCPPSFTDATHATMMMADLCIVPITPSPLDMNAAKIALEHWRQTREWRRGLPEVLLIPNRVDLRTRQGRIINDLLATMGSRVAPSIGYRMAFVEAATKGIPVTEYEPDGPAADDIRSLAKAVHDRLEALRQRQEAGEVAGDAEAGQWGQNDKTVVALDDHRRSWIHDTRRAGSGFISRLLSWG